MLAGTAAAAEEPNPIAAGKAQISLRTTVISHSKETIESRDDDSLIEEERLVSTGIGIGLSYLGIGLGYAAVDNLVIGSGLSVGYTSDGEGDSEKTVLTLNLSPHVSYNFLSGVIRPFVVGGAEFVIFRFADKGRDSIQNAWALMPNGAGGVHFFLNRYVSFDSKFTIGYLFGTSGVYTQSPLTEKYKKDRFKHHGYAFGLSLGVNCWF
jgi:hypothetical protein